MLTQEEKEKMIVALRGTSVAKENITEEYKKNLDLAEREKVSVTTSEGPVPCYIFTAKNRTSFTNRISPSCFGELMLNSSPASS